MANPSFDSLHLYVKQNPLLTTILERMPNLNLPNWYLGAGSIAQTVWNIHHQFDPTAHIKDYDVIYYDAIDPSYEAEDLVIRQVGELFSDLEATIEVRNQSRVHLWYESHFGYPIEPIISSEDAIDRWPIFATCMGLNQDSHGSVCLYAPYGIEDTLDMLIRPNKRQITEAIYMEKAKRWKNTWPNLSVLPWDEK